MDLESKTICNYSMNDDQSNEEEGACILALQLAAGSVLPMVLKAAIELELLELIKKAGSSSASASELAAQLPTNNPDAANMVDRMLRLLAANSVLNCSLRRLGDGGIERRYSLAAVGKFFTSNEDGVSIVPMTLLGADRVNIEAWYHLKDAVLEGGLLFDRAHGFEGVKSLVDIGGGIGASLKMIISKYPTIKGINFDLPHVIRNAQPYPGVENVAGDMFVSVPKAEAIFMKWICHNWSDAHCEKLLKNCYQALPENGKVIVADAVLPEDPDNGLSSKNSTIADVIMMAINPGGKERTEMELQVLSKKAGFRQFIKVCVAYNTWIMEFQK